MYQKETSPFIPPGIIFPEFHKKTLRLNECITWLNTFSSKAPQSSLSLRPPFLSCHAEATINKIYWNCRTHKTLLILEQTQMLRRENDVGRGPILSDFLPVLCNLGPWECALLDHEELGFIPRETPYWFERWTWEACILGRLTSLPTGNKRRKFHPSLSPLPI